MGSHKYPSTATDEIILHKYGLNKKLSNAHTTVHYEKAKPINHYFSVNTS